MYDYTPAAEDAEASTMQVFQDYIFVGNYKWFIVVRHECCGKSLP